jgi:hypothetical protein
LIWGDDAEMKVLETQNKVCSAMFDHEKEKPKLNKEQKIEIAQTAQVTIEDVDDVMTKHRQL